MAQTMMSRPNARARTRYLLEDTWERNSAFVDMRFGQFMSNLLGFVGGDPWFITDEEWPEVIHQFGEKAAKPGQYRGEATYERP